MDWKYNPKYNSAYIEGNDIYSIARVRTEHLEWLGSRDKNFQIAIQKNGYWSKWDRFPLPRILNFESIASAEDVHRTICDFEIVCESDYITYKENVESMRFVGDVLEDLGYKCHYYYSGGKGIHIHIFIDYAQFNSYNQQFKHLFDKYITSPDDFKQKFIKYERAYIHSRQDKYILDEQLISGRHLIRSELSMHKNGSKTFLGHSYKDITPFEYECSPKTKLYPELAMFDKEVEKDKLGMIHYAKWTYYDNPADKLREFFNYLIQNNTFKESKKIISKPGKMRTMVQNLYDRPKSYDEDGRKRAFFVICQELKLNYDKEQAMEMAINWNNRLANPLEEHIIKYHINREQNYKLTNKYIEKVIREITK